VYLCPSDPEASTSRRTDYLAVVGSETAWPGATSVRIKSFSEGATNTIFLVEDTQRDIHWMEPRDLELDQFDYTINSSSGRGISTNHGRGAHVLMVDGSVRCLSADTSPEVVKSLIKIDAGQE
jgi:prepilin-type processing-associated H-X9-DG protein